MKSTEFLLRLNELIHKLQSVSIIDNSFFILGAGKFGKIALQYAMKQPDSPYILVIDKDIDKSADIFQEFSDVTNIHEVFSSETQRKFFLERDIGIVSELLQCVFPGSFIPAIPLHAVAYVINGLYNSLQPEISLHTQIPKSKWSEIISSIPKEVILKEDMENGVILLSWAKMNEMCPPNCDAPIDHCPHHQRKKPYTITEISQGIKISYLGNLTIESYQVQPGLGIIQGAELKQLIIDFFNQIKGNIESERNSLLLLSTTCNCHGVIHVFSV